MNRLINSSVSSRGDVNRRKVVKNVITSAESKIMEG